MKEIKTTQVKSAWIQKKHRSKEAYEDKNESDECSEVMDILLSLLPEILNKRGNAGKSDRSIEEIEAELVTDIQNMKRAESEQGLEEEIDETMEQNDTAEIDTAENRSDQAFPAVNNIDTAENNMPENDESEAYSHDRNILQDITSRLLSGQRSKKWRDIQLTPVLLFTEFLNNATNIQKFIVKELDMIGEVYTEYTGCSIPFKKSDNKAKK